MTERAPCCGRLYLLSIHLFSLSITAAKASIFTASPCDSQQSFSKGRQYAAGALAWPACSTTVGALRALLEKTEAVLGGRWNRAVESGLVRKTDGVYVREINE